MAKSGIHIKPSKRGTFKAQASKMGMGVQEAASKILSAPEGRYSPAMRKKANFARNFAKEYGGGLMEEMQEIRQGGVPEVFEEIREGEHDDIMAMRHMGVMPKLPGVHPPHYADNQYAYGGNIPRKASLSTTGLAANKKPKDYSENQLRIGIDVEHEHTGNNALAMKIAMDHLEEDPQYYTRLPDPEEAAQQGAASDALGYANGGQLPQYQWGGETFGEGQFARHLGTGQLASRHEDLENLKYLDLPDTDWGSLAMNVGGAALSAYGGAGGDFGGAISGLKAEDISGLGSSLMGASSGSLAGANVVGGQYGGFDMGAMGGLATGQYMQRQGADFSLRDYLQQRRLAEAQGLPAGPQGLPNSAAGPMIEQMGAAQFGAGPQPTVATGRAGFQDGGQIPTREPLRLADPEKTELNVSTQEDYDMIFGGLVDEPQEGYVPIYQDGGQLLGYLPEYGFGSWLGDNAGKILKGVGGVVSVIPGFGQIAGPILIGAGYATDAIVGHVRKKRAEEELVEAQGREEAAAQKRETTSALASQFDPTKNIDYGATFETYQMGGGLMEQSQSQGSMMNPIIADYRNGQTHDGPQQGIPVDVKGNPSTVSRQSAVGLTERGEVTWNGYVFSDKLTV